MLVEDFGHLKEQENAQVQPSRMKEQRKKEESKRTGNPGGKLKGRAEVPTLKQIPSWWGNQLGIEGDL